MISKNSFSYFHFKGGVFMKKFYYFSVLFLILSLIISSCTGMQDGIDEELAPVESIDILVLESFPVQINVLINGYLPNPCYEITQIEKHREGNTFYVKLMMKDSGLVCIQIIQSYQEIVALDVYGLSADTYYVDVNGIVAIFTLDVDNILPDLYVFFQREEETEYEGGKLLFQSLF